MASSEQKGAQGDPQATEATGRRTVLGRTGLWVAGLLVVAIAGMVNYLAYRHYERWDWTASQQFTLSDRTEKVLGELSRPIDVYIFLSDFEPNFQDVRELLQRYKAHSDRIEVHYVNPDRRPTEFAALMRKFGIKAAQLESGEVLADVAAVVSTGEDHWQIKRTDLISLDFDPTGAPEEAKVDVKTEQAITGAILQVTQGTATKICATEGHGEWAVDGGAAGRSLWAVEEELRRSNIELEAIATRGKSAVPDDCDAVFVIGPTRAFSEEEAKLLGDYVRGGGGLLLALDPVLEHERVQATGLESMTRELGIRVDPTVVLELDPARLLTPSPMEAFIVTNYGDHETTKPFHNMPTAVHVARSLRVTDAEKASKLLETSEQAYAESDLAGLDPTRDLEPDADDVEGPLTLAAAHEREGEGNAERKGRIIVVGDSDFLQRDFLHEPQFVNADLIGAWSGWLTERKALISIAPRKIDAASMLMTEEDLQALLFRVIVLMPAAVILLGVAVWWSRRS